MIDGPHPLGEVDRQLLDGAVLGVKDQSVDARNYLLLQARQLHHRQQLREDRPTVSRILHSCAETIDA